MQETSDIYCNNDVVACGSTESSNTVYEFTALNVVCFRIPPTWQPGKAQIKEISSHITHFPLTTSKLQREKNRIHPFERKRIIYEDHYIVAVV
jgi:hypothetical protein